MIAFLVLAGIAFLAVLITLVAVVDILRPVDRYWNGWENSREDVEEYAMWSSYDERL